MRKVVARGYRHGSIDLASEFGVGGRGCLQMPDGTGLRAAFGSVGRSGSVRFQWTGGAAGHACTGSLLAESGRQFLRAKETLD